LLLLTKLDGSTALINLDAIKYIEATPDTRVIFLNGEFLIVRESLDVIQENVLKLKAGILNRIQQSASDVASTRVL
jgi:uncharacterized protein YlzI (FlbEa/FlbD family)